MDRAERYLRVSIAKASPATQVASEGFGTMHCRLLDRTPSERFRSKLVFLNEYRNVPQMRLRCLSLRFRRLGPDPFWLKHSAE
jgi:hypothetical protein